jgi:hypothetical protein
MAPAAASNYCTVSESQPNYRRIFTLFVLPYYDTGLGRSAPPSMESICFCMLIPPSLPSLLEDSGQGGGGQSRTAVNKNKSKQNSVVLVR